MKIKYLILFLFTVISLNACSNASKNHDQLIPIENLLAEFPSQNLIQKTLLFNAILEHGEPGIDKTTNFLGSDDAALVQQAKYALNGLATYVINAGNEQNRLLFVAGIHKALRTHGLENDIFLIDQLQLCAKDESIENLGWLLKDEKYFNPALRVLKTINSTKSAPEILDSIEDAPDHQKIAMINSLAQMNHPFVAEELLPWVKSENDRIKAATLFALAHFAYKPAESILKKAVEDKPAYADFYIDFARNLSFRGEKQISIRICREVLNNAESVYAENHKINALNLLVEIDKNAAFEFVNALSNEENLKIRKAALNIAADYKDPQKVQKWITLSKNSNKQRKIEIIELLANIGSDKSISYLQEELQNDSFEIRKTALSAILSFNDFDLIKSTNYLKGNLLRAEQKVLQSKLEQMDTATITSATASFADFSNPVKKVFIETLIEKGFKTYNPLYLSEIENEDVAVQGAAIKALANTGSDSELKTLLNHLIQSEDDSKTKNLASAIVKINGRSRNQAENIKHLTEEYASASIENKIKLMRVFSGISHKSFFSLLKNEINNGRAELRNAALKSLFQWKNNEALDFLIEIAKNHKDETQRIFAIRAVTRLLNQKKISAPFALEYYKKIMEAAFRPEEKRLVFSGLAKLETKSSLQYLTGFLKDPDSGYDAFLAAMSIAKIEDESNLSRQDIAIGLIKGLNYQHLNEKIESEYQSKHNAIKPPPGFTALFNGKDLSGWKGLVENPSKRAAMSEKELASTQQKADSSMAEHWKVENNILYFDGKGHSLCTVKDYQDFEMFVDWKIEKHGDSGIYLRGSPQVQIWDTAQWPEGSGGLYNNQKNPRKPLVKADNPIGEWNTFRIIMRGEKVTVFLNDVLVVDNVTLENYWERDKPIYPIGQIELQSHNSPLFFKNIFIKELKPAEQLYTGPLFNNKDLTGWQVIDNKPESWQVKNKVLSTTGEGGGWLSTKNEYENFALQLEYKISSGGNSGIFLRAPHQGDPAYSGIEIQVLDDYAPKYADLKEWQYTGSIYGLQASKKRVTSKSGVWQKMEISYIGPSIKVKLNDENIVDTNLIEFMEQESTHPGIKRRKGFIGLQNHGSIVEYRNIKITEIR